MEFKAINNQVLEKIRKDRNTLEQYLATDENSRRKRNSYFGVIGKIQKTLFGVLIEEEGEEFEDVELQYYQRKNTPIFFGFKG